MAATQAVLETYELLEKIIVLLPATQIREVKCVSKFWRDLIKRSNPIREARCIRPYDKETITKLAKLTDAGLWHEIIIYEGPQLWPHCKLKVREIRLLCADHEKKDLIRRRFVCSLSDVDIVRDVPSIRMLEDYRKEFVTFPATTSRYLMNHWQWI